MQYIIGYQILSDRYYYRCPYCLFFRSTAASNFYLAGYFAVQLFKVTEPGRPKVGKIVRAEILQAM